MKLRTPVTKEDERDKQTKNIAMKKKLGQDTRQH